MNRINGKEIADKILVNLKKEIKSSGSTPGLAVLLIGNNKASQVYINLKEKAAKKVGINFEKILFDEHVEEDIIVSKIEKLNENENIHGIIVQLPLPEKFNTDKIINTVSLEKDADGFRENSLNKNPAFPSAILKMIESVDRDVESVVIAAKSEKFGEMMTEVLKRGNIESKYIFCDKINDEDLNNCDAIITACGMPKLINSDMIKNEMIIIDGGIKKENDGVVGDVDMDSFKNTDCYISPVPGGVGPVTVACLLEGVYSLSLKK